MALRLAAPLLDLDAQLGKLGADFVGVGFLAVALVDGDEEGDFRRLGVADGLLRLRHDRVVRRHNDDGEVGDLCTAGTHGRESLVTRGVDEGHPRTVLQLDAVRTDVLRDAAGLTVDDIGVADVVEQGGLSVVDVAHDRDDWWAGDEVVLAVHFHIDGLLHFCGDKVHAIAKLFGDDADGLFVQALVDRNHHAQRHAGGNDLVDGDVHHRGQFRGCHKFGQLQRMRRFHLCELLALGTFGLGVALGAAGLRTGLGLLAFAQTGERFLDLLLDVLVGNLLAGCAGDGATALAGLLSSGFHIHLGDALPLPLFSGCGGFLLDGQFNLAHDGRSSELFRFGPNHFSRWRWCFGSFCRLLVLGRRSRWGCWRRNCFGCGFLRSGFRFLGGRLFGLLLRRDRVEVHFADHLHI